MHPLAASPVVLSFLGTIIIALVSWSGGSKIAQYLGPQLGAVASALNQSVIKKFTNSTNPVESPSTETVEEDGSLASTDIQEMNQKG